MEPIPTAFNRLRLAHHKALIPFIMGGDPTLSATGELLVALQDAGADLLEVGIPFSDPLADGPVIQAASARALAYGATPSSVLQAIRRVRPRLHVPVVCLTYWNPLMQFEANGQREAGQAFVHAARACGVDGIIVPDLPVEESHALCAMTREAQVSTVLLAAPTSPAQRLRMIANASQGFIYYVSVTGTTGVRRALPSGLVHGVRQLKRLTTKPICVGFGISTPAQAAAVARIADGVIIGSALIYAMALATSRAGVIRNAQRFLGRLRRVV